MLTTRIDSKTFLIGQTSWNVGQQVELTLHETALLEEISSLGTTVNETKLSIFDQCYQLTSAYDAVLSNTFFMHEQNTRRLGFLTSTLMHEVCKRLGGLLPLRISTEGNKGVFVRDMTNPSETVVLTNDLVRRASRFDNAIGDVRLFMGAMIGSDVLAGIAKTSTKAYNWSLMGCPYVKAKTEDVAVELAEADKWDTFKWKDVEGSVIDNLLVSALGSSLEMYDRLEHLRTGAWPYSAMVFLIGPKETLGLNVGEVRSDQERVNLLHREATRVKAKYAVFIQFGQISTSGSTADFSQQNGPTPPGFTIAIAMRSTKSEKLLMGGKAWRVDIGPDKQPVLNVHASYEGNLGIPDPKAIDIVEHIMSSTRPVASLVK